MAAISHTPHRPAGSAKTSGLVTAPGPLATYDFQQPSTLPREHVHTMRAICDAFAHRLTALLTANLRVVCRVTPTAVTQSSGKDHLATHTEAMVFAPLRLEPLPGTAVLELTLAASLTCLDHLLGGSGGVQPQRPPTEIEAMLLGELLSAVLPELRVVLAELVHVEPILGPLEYEPGLILPTDPLVVGAFELAIGEAHSVLSLCLPLPAVLPALRRFHELATVSVSERTARQTARELLTDRLQDVPIEVSVRFNSARLFSDELLALGPGDVVSLDHPVERPLAITAAGSVFGRAVATRRGTRLACRVVASADQEESA